MKTKLTTGIVILTAVAAALSVWTACKKDNVVTPTTDVHSALRTDACNQNALVFPPQANMYGMSYGQWSAEWWKWIYVIGCNNNPLTDTTGALQTQQTDHVYFLAGTAGGPAVTRNVTIPSGKAVFVPILNYNNTYPCPDTSFHPAAGETLEHFLTAGAQALINEVDVLQVELDGCTLTNLSSYRAVSPMYTFTGNPSLATCLDPCVTGTAQQAVSDGYWLMLKPMSIGTHTLHEKGGVTALGFLAESTYHITVQ